MGGHLSCCGTSGRFTWVECCSAFWSEGSLFDPRARLGAAAGSMGAASGVGRADLSRALVYGPSMGGGKNDARLNY